jgi:hypothetical protein
VDEKNPPPVTPGGSRQGDDIANLLRPILASWTGPTRLRDGELELGWVLGSELLKSLIYLCQIISGALWRRQVNEDLA